MIDLLAVCDVSDRDASASRRRLYLTGRHLPLPADPKISFVFSRWKVLFVFSLEVDHKLEFI